MMFPQHFYRLLEFYYCNRTKRHSESEFCEFERKSMCHMAGITYCSCDAVNHGGLTVRYRSGAAVMVLNQHA